MTTPNTTTTSSTYGEFHGTTENSSADGFSAPNGYPAGPTHPAPNGYQGYAYPAAPMAPDPPAADRSRIGVPWFIAGVTLWAIAVAHLMLLPEWMETKTTDGVVGNLTGVLAEIGIGAALLAVGFARRRQDH